MKTNKWKFKRNWLNQQVLYIKHRVPGSFPGDWNYVWFKATQQDVIEFETEIALVKDKIEIVTKMKESHPEFFLIN